VPALRERREDIPALVSHFMTSASGATGLPVRAVSDDAMAALQAHDWPGNVRQLRNVIDWILIMAVGNSSEVVRADMLPAEISKISPNSFTEDSGSEIMSLPLRDAREIFERKYLEAQVTRFGGNISRTASFVGMERSALHRKLRSLGISSTERQ
jgi:two-component system nitrogen regulation response regulator NtrX